LNRRDGDHVVSYAAAGSNRPMHDTEIGERLTDLFDYFDPMRDYPNARAFARSGRNDECENAGFAATGWQLHANA
jgi:hypothetical protein